MNKLTENQVDRLSKLIDTQIDKIATALNQKDCAATDDAVMKSIINLRNLLSLIQQDD